MSEGRQIAPQDFAERAREDKRTDLWAKPSWLVRFSAWHASRARGSQASVTAGGENITEEARRSLRAVWTPLSISAMVQTDQFVTLAPM